MKLALGFLETLWHAMIEWVVRLIAFLVRLIPQSEIKAHPMGGGGASVPQDPSTITNLLQIPDYVRRISGFIVGLRISHSQHHRHSYYVIRHSDVLTGLTDTEIEMIALVARYHRKSAPKESHPEFARLTTDDQRVVRTLAGLLRVAIGLDRSHDQRVRQATVSRRDDELVIGVVSREAADLEVELYVANERKALLEQVLGLPIVVEQIEAMGRGASGAKAAS